METKKSGRPRIECQKEEFEKQVARFQRGEITAAEAAAAIGVSRMTLFRRMREANKLRRAGSSPALPL